MAPGSRRCETWPPAFRRTEHMQTPEVQTVLFKRDGITLCRFRCAADNLRWKHENRIDDGHNIAFPELPVEIRPADHPGLLADPNLAVFYNHGDAYRRRLSHPDGDSANIFMFDSKHLLPAIAPYVPDAEPERPLSIRFGQVRPRTYLKQRLLLARAAPRPSPDSDWVIEQALEILDEVLAAGYGDPLPTPVSRSTALRSQYERVDEIKRLLSRYYAEPISLNTLAESVETSVFHLCRIFRKQTGQTIHGYLQRLRLRAGLALLEKTDRPLAHLALDVGYAHQSHFTEAFRGEYGLPPGKLRRQFVSPVAS
jgi:AraC-like DNA-binding protein